MLDIDYFAPNTYCKNNRVVRRPSCEACRRIIDGKNLNAEGKRHGEAIKPKLGIIWECPICGKKTIPGYTSKIVLDHDHLTGEPREWICDSCNTGIGRFKDDINILKKAISYLEKYKK